ncbi:uncharacterized protein LOC114248881 [Bombyx mandarina]|uniref:Ig-like domain-containing protein n=2 Tax=Bombyx TaxID=7090 RepID=A0A8R2DMB3_BOMMO|nr:uncharacterized protein LOC101737121 [Bombyx mori]XP_028038111.1 uncharacterized protein LOC114248881 [Bombyx mandarina]
MCAPATAALLIAALAALPCRGTDANGSTVLNEANNLQQADSQPTINRLYQMLHAKPDSHNQSQLYDNSNYSRLNLIHSFNSYSNLGTVKSQVDLNIDDFKPKANNVSFEGTHLTNNYGMGKRNRKRGIVNIIRIDEVTSAISIETTTMARVSPSPVAMERKKKPGEIGSSAPLLNYIFDAYSNTHHHRNEKTGDGNSIYAAAAPEIEALVGSTAHLDCKVDALHDKLVSWVRRKSDEDPMELLTTGTQQYTADDRYSARFIPPDIWRLEVREVRPTDAAHYDCQLSAHPPRTARVTLKVPEVSVTIVDGAGAAVSEQVCEVSSTVALRCEVKGLKMEGGPSLLWYRKDDLLNDDTTRGGISVRTEFGANGASSVLRVARVRADDAGRYTCTVARAPPPAPLPAHVILHVIKGESLAELHQSGNSCAASKLIITTLCVLLEVLS